MDARILECKTSIQQFKTLWDQLKRLKHAFPNAPMWWERACKRRIQCFLRRALADGKRDHRAMENYYYYECIYGILQQAAPTPKHATLCKNLKQKSCDFTARGYNNFLPTTTQRTGSIVNSQPHTTCCKCERRGTSELLLRCETWKVLSRSHPEALPGPSPHI